MGKRAGLGLDVISCRYSSPTEFYFSNMCYPLSDSSKNQPGNKKSSE